MHTDPEILSLLALGEHVGTEHDRDHAHSCPECARELSELRGLVTLGRSPEPALALPSQEVWARIREELGFDATPEAPVSRFTVLPSQTRVSPELSGHAQLKPIEVNWSHASGSATLATDAHGRRLLEVNLDADLPTFGLRQAWLVHRDDPTVRQTLGILDGPYGLWTVEHSIDLEKYTILDISQQSAGDTEHSGQTIVRGEFTLVS